MIRMENVEKSYPYKGGRTWVLRRVTLSVEPGEFVSIMGPSGSGKSTFLAIAGMLDGEFDGDYRFDGESVREAGPRGRNRLHRENVGFVFQQFHLLEDLTVYENLEIPLSYRNVARKERQARVAEVLDRFQMVGKKDLFPTQLSGGQQQVAVARAVIAEPRVILADEPTGSLHWSQGERIMELLSELNAQGTTIIQVTHDERVARFGRRTVELSDGWITADRSPQAGDALDSGGTVDAADPGPERDAHAPRTRG